MTSRPVVSHETPEIGHQKPVSDEFSHATRCTDAKASELSNLQPSLAALCNEEKTYQSAVVVYAKENIFVQPGLKCKRISGRLSLLKKAVDDIMFLAWLPYALNNTSDSATDDNKFVVISDGGPALSEANSSLESEKRDRTLYAVHPVPISDIRAVRRHTPTIGWHHIIIVLHTGLSLPPLYFTNGGVKDFLTVLKQHTCIVRSPDDPNLYLVNDIADPLQRSMTALDLLEVQTRAGWSESAGGSASLFVRGGKDDLDTSSPRDYSLGVLEHFSRVTKLARDTTAHIFGKDQGPDASTWPCEGEETLIKLNYPPQGMLAVNCADGEDEAPVLRVVQSDDDEAAPCESNSQSRCDDGESASTSVGSFELLESERIVSSSKRIPSRAQRPFPLSVEEWCAFFEPDGRLADERGFRERAFYGGIDQNVRKEAWKYLLGYMPFNSTVVEREQIREAKKTEYEALKAQWQSISASQEKRFTKFRERRLRIDKDVVRTDRRLPFYAEEDNSNVELLRSILMTYTFYNFDLGYCQGMSDLLSPILYVMEDEVDAFWCFVGLMDVMESNFHRDQNGMHSQLQSLKKLVQLLDPQLHCYLEKMDCLNYFFCYRWVLITFKREFEYSLVLRLWEALWSKHLCEHFHLFVCAAVLQKHRRAIIHGEMEFDTLLRFINDLSGKIDLEVALYDAEMLFQYAGEAGQEVLPTSGP